MQNDHTPQLSGRDYFWADDMLPPEERLRMAEALFVHDAEALIPFRSTVTAGAPIRTSARSVVPLSVSVSAGAVALALMLWATGGSKRIHPRSRGAATRPARHRTSA